MKTETFKEVKTISLLLAFMHLGGYLFFCDRLTGSFIHILYITSTGLALLVLPLIPGRLLCIKFIKFLVLFIGITGVINNIHTMVEMIVVALRHPNRLDPIGFIIGIMVIIVLGTMIRGIVAPKHLYEDLWKKPASDEAEENEEGNI